MDRAWVFLLLARQQGIDAAILALPDPADALHRRVRPWVVGVLSEGRLYLFDPALGLPIPGSNGLKRGEAEPLEIQPATLEEVAADDSLLRRMDADKEHRYAATSADVRNVVALVEASPTYLAERMRLLEATLSGDDRMVLTTSASGQAERLKACRHIAEVRLWDRPYEAVFQRSLLGPQWKQRLSAAMLPFKLPSLVGGQTLRQYVEEPEVPLFTDTKERLADPKSVSLTRQRKTTTTERSEDAPQSPLWKARVKHLKGKWSGEMNALYQMARPSDADLRATKQLSAEAKQMYLEAKQDASYWLGLSQFEQRSYGSARDWLDTRTLAAAPGGVWTAGAKYNLARTEEADGRIAEAIRQYRANRDLPDGHGNLLRGLWLEKVTGVHPTGTVPSAGGTSRQALPSLPALPSLDEPPASPRKQTHQK